MAKYIAHSSIDENGKIAGGSAGDQTKKEVCIRTMYYKPWNQFFHIVNDAVRKQFGNNMIDIAKNNNIGYDQNQRNTLLKQAKKVNFDFSKIATKCECDCSSCITIALLGAIYTVLGAKAYEKALAILVVGGNCATTSTFKTRVANLKGIVTITCYTSITYTGSTSKAVFGDIYNKSGSHIICYIDDGKKVGSAELEVDGIWGKDTTTRLQEIFGTTVDGVISNQDAQFKSTNPGLLASTFEWKSKPNGNGSQLIKAMQKWAGMATADRDGEIGPETILYFQKKLGTYQDGCVSKPSAMVKALQKWANNV